MHASVHPYLLLRQMTVNKKQARANSKPPVFIKVNITVTDTSTATIFVAVTPSYGM